MRAPRISSNTSRCFLQAGWRSGGGSLIQMLLGMRHFAFFHYTGGRKRGFKMSYQGTLQLIAWVQKLPLTGTNIANRNLFISFCECIVEVIFFAVNLPSQITLLSLRISYVFSSLSLLNLPLSCPEPFVANRARRSKVFKVDLWVGNSADLNAAYGSLPTAFCSPQACGACRLSFVFASCRASAPMLPAGSLCWDTHETMKASRTSLCLRQQWAETEALD